MKKIMLAVMLVAVAGIFASQSVFADCCGSSEVVNVDASGFKNVKEYRCWSMDEKIIFKSANDYAIYNCSVGVGSPIGIEEIAHTIYVYPSSAVKNLAITFNKRVPLRIKVVRERREDEYGKVILNDFAEVRFAVKPEDVPNNKFVNFTVVIRAKLPVEFSFRPEVFKYPVR